MSLMAFPHNSFFLNNSFSVADDYINRFYTANKYEKSLTEMTIRRFRTIDRNNY